MTCTVEVIGHITAPPSVDELIQMARPCIELGRPRTSVAVERGYLPERVFQIRHKTNHMAEHVTAIHFWIVFNGGLI